MIEVELPYPPTVNHYWGLSRAGRWYIKAAGKRFRDDVVGIMAEQQIGPIQGKLDMQIAVFPPDHRRRDVDNVLKALLDALEHGEAYENDNQIKRLEIEMCEPMDGGTTKVWIREYRKREDRHGG